MSFLKISDPVKRDLIVKEYLDLKRIFGIIYSQRELENNNYKMTFQSFLNLLPKHKKLQRERLRKNLKEGIENLPRAITFPAYPSIQAVEGEETIVAPYFIGDIAESFLKKFTTKDEADRTYGLHDKKNQFYIGKKKVYIKENNIMVEDGKEYEGTLGLWELIVSKNPDKSLYTPDDEKNYARLMVQSVALHHKNNPNRPRGNKSDKLKYILSEIWKNRKQFEGSGVIVIPSEPNALLERLDLLLSSQEAGHTGVGNELVSICDELKRQGVLDTKAYKTLNSIIKK